MPADSPRRLRSLNWLWWSLWFAVGFVLVSFVTGFILERLPLMTLAKLNTPLGTAGLTVITDLLLVAVVIGLPAALKLSRLPFRRSQAPTANRNDLGLRGLPTWVDILLGILLLIAYFVATGLITLVLQKLLPNLDWAAEQSIGGFRLITNGLDFVLTFATLVVFVPVVEEILFRGFLYHKLKINLPWWVAALVVSLLFSVAHGQWNVGVAVFALSFIACGLRELTGTIYAGIILHMFKNAIAFYALFGA